MAKNLKTNAMRILDKAKISYEVLEYPHTNEALEGNEVAALMGQNPAQVFKTLVAKGKSGEYYVFDIPVNRALDLKKAAKAACEKNIEMTHVKDLVKICGYARGNVSPIGMKSSYKTIFDSSVSEFESVYISAGKIGFQLKLNPNDVIKLINAKTDDITKPL
ncbi:MAG: Cys-tRNA(Pro) deacylase [Ruminococcus sp.]|nr:Cys-tRNA(Pro) deacylase [Ruminococcus sp.]